MNGPEHIRGPVWAALLEALGKAFEFIRKEYGPFCECPEQEAPVNPRRECSKCGAFITFCGDDGGIADWMEWTETNAATDGETRTRCALEQASSRFGNLDRRTT